MNNRKLASFVLCAFFALCSLAEAQQPKVPKIGEITFGRRPGGLGTGRQLFRRELRALGYVEGKNISFESRSADGKLEQYPTLVDELIRLKVDILVATSTEEILAFKNATRTIRIVFITAGDPVEAGLVDSLARPGGNITVVHRDRGGVGRQAPRIAPGNSSQTFPGCGAMGSAELSTYSSVERKPIFGTTTEFAALLHGGKQRRQIRGGV
jgi:hypothetical protein